MAKRWTRVLALHVLLGATAAFSADSADLILWNGKIVTMDSAGTVAEALAIKGDRILAVGTNEEVSKLCEENTQRIDLRHWLVVPGFIEGHGHFIGLGESKMMLNLRSAKTWNDVVSQVERAARQASAGDWVIGQGWHQEKWTTPPSPNVDGYPVHSALSAVSPNNPVLLTHASGHMCFANAKAMELAGVVAATKDPIGGQIVRDREGDPIGVFRETAQSLITRARAASEQRSTAEQREQRMLRSIEVATEECLKNGITSFQDAGSSFETIDVFSRLADAGDLRGAPVGHGPGRQRSS